MVDSEDLSKSFLVRRFIGKGKGTSEDGEDADVVDEDAAALARQENGTVTNDRPSAPRSGRSWGARGISVSADDTLAEHDRANAANRDAQLMTDPAAFVDEEEEEDADAPPPPAKDTAYRDATSTDKFDVGDEDEVEDFPTEGVGSSAEEWQENTGGK